MVRSGGLSRLKMLRERKVLTLDYAHIDEARLVRHFDTAWLTVVSRLRKSGRCRVPINPAVWVTTTTDSPGSTLYNTTENPETASPEMRILSLEYL